MARTTIGAIATFNGQTYTCVGVTAHERANRRVTELAIWESRCPECGEAFTFQTSVTRGIVSPNRRCARHRKPGIKVRMNANAGGDGSARTEE
ncbi:hypothetical protein ACDY96_25920 [Rhizobium mongolense]|uniref:hypothetical protein n=1 Tax=Rhizobium mongolense TaxID=57676 RepID=UPI003558E685